MKKASNLEDNEVLYFYNLLYILERETQYDGFNIQRIDKNLKRTVHLNSDFIKDRSIPKPSVKNTINFRGRRQKTKQFLKHIRNSFAHGLIESRGNAFYFLDMPSGKNPEKDATMQGCMSKITFYKLMKAIVKTHQRATEFL